MAEGNVHQWTVDGVVKYLHGHGFGDYEQRFSCKQLILIFVFLYFI